MRAARMLGRESRGEAQCVCVRFPGPARDCARQPARACVARAQPHCATAPHRRSPHGPHPLLPPLPPGAGQATRAAQAECASTHGRTQGVARREGGAAQSGGRRSRAERRAPPASPAASRGRRRLRGATASSQRLPLPLPAPTHSPLPHTSFPPRPRLLWPRLRCPPRTLCRTAQRAGALRTLAAARRPPPPAHRSAQCVPATFGARAAAQAEAGGHRLNFQQVCKRKRYIAYTREIRAQQRRQLVSRYCGALRRAFISSSAGASELPLLGF